MTVLRPAGAVFYNLFGLPKLFASGSSRLFASGSSRRPGVMRRFGMALAALAAVLVPATAFANEMDLKLPMLEPGQRTMLMAGLGVCVLGMLFGLVMFNQVKAMPAHKAMLDV